MSKEWISVADRMPTKKVLATYKNSADKNRIIVASYFGKNEVESYGEDDDFDEYDEASDCYYYVSGWYEQQDNWGEYASIYVNEGEVTHWMSLPDLPNDVQKILERIDKTQKQLTDSEEEG